MDAWIRQTHRWLSIVFTVAVIANFVAMALVGAAAVDRVLAAAAAVPDAGDGALHVRPALRAAWAMSGEAPRLLSGGNPQIPKGHGDRP